MRRWRWIGHTLRKPHNKITRQALQWNLQENRDRGIPRETLKRGVEREMTMMGKEWGVSLEILPRTEVGGIYLCVSYTPPRVKGNDDDDDEC
ncbi:hypothetical protein ElyMa_006193500 [Elysia marginata]|uniref:Uncharacterized protein n=1 Tax=Elysia marginata TaxID=1093978 RepID=A0AAV4H3Q8_9GAST|nr:hypothetical protein ElyMa_006193500 [Elysia marginata]